MAKKKIYTETVEQMQHALDKTLHPGNLERILQQRIQELEERIRELSDVDNDTKLNHRADSLFTALGRSEEQVTELERVVGAWMRKAEYEEQYPVSYVLEQVEKAPVRLRDQLLLMFMLGTHYKPHSPSGPQIMIGGGNPLAAIMEMLKNRG